MVFYLRPLLVFIYGYALGMLIAYLVFTNRHPDRVFTWKYIFEIENNIEKNISENLESVNEYELMISNQNYDILKNNVLLLCVMFVKDIENAYVSSNTWMKKCNHQLYFGVKSDNYLDIIKIKASNSWHFLCSVFQYIYKDFNESYDWILFSKDSSFVIPENLRHLVFSLNSSDPYYLGHKALFWNTYFNSGRSSYVVSKGTIDALMKKFTSNEECMNSGQNQNMEDYYLGKHLAQLGIYPRDTRDHKHRARFHVVPLNFLLKPIELGKIPEFESRSVYKEEQGKDCCSPGSISFPVSSISSVYFYSYLIYIVRLRKDAGMFNTSFADDRVWKDFILEWNPNTNLSSITAQKYYAIWNDIVDPPAIFNQKLRELFLSKKQDT